MTTDLILKASAIITMDDSTPRARALAIDTGTGRITVIGSVSEVQAAAPGVPVTDLGDIVLMPGFIDPHSHPLLSGMATQKPAYWISPGVGVGSWDEVKKIFAQADKENPAGQILIFNGVDRLLQQAPLPTRAVLDEIFPQRPVAVIDNSGHGLYFNSATLALLGWPDGKAPADPVGGSFGRNTDGTSDGTAYESGAVMVVMGVLLPKAIPHPLHSGALFYQLMARCGITATSEHTYNSKQYQAYAALASVPDCPLRLHAYHMSIEPDAGADIDFPNPDMVRKTGIKLWADGSPWLGNIAISFEYLDNETTRTAQIEQGPRGEPLMNYTRAQLDAILDELHYDSIYHEHLFYHSLASMEQLLRRAGLTAFDLATSPISGGSLVVYCAKYGRPASPSLAARREREAAAATNTLERWQAFSRRSVEHARRLRTTIDEALARGARIIGYGASARSSGSSSADA